jgi:hypothetical protein
MKLIPRHRQHQRVKLPRIAISEEEIAADLHYPAARRRTAKPTAFEQAGWGARR